MRIRIALATVLFAYAHHAEAYEATNLCRGNAFRLCLDEISDPERVAACLLRRKADLSPGCQTMFTPKQGPAGRADRPPIDDPRIT